MEWDREREEQKRAELLTILAKAIPHSGDQPHAIAEKVLEAFVKTSPPEKEPVVMHLMTMRFDGRGGGKSVKAGNIILNMGALIDTVAAGALTVVGALQAPFTVPFAAIVLWNTIWRAAEVTISENEAAVLYVMWTQRDKNHEIPKEGLLERCNAHFRKVQRQPLTQRDLAHSLRTLEGIETIASSQSRPSNWCLREWVRVTYR